MENSPHLVLARINELIIIKKKGDRDGECKESCKLRIPFISLLFLGVGVAAKNTSVDLFGVQDSYIINITSSKPSETPMFTIDVVKKKKVILQTEFAFLVDQGKRLECKYKHKVRRNQKRLSYILSL